MITSTKKLERLVALCKLWAAVKYFHPYLAYREDIDWDSALIAVIPKANAANNSKEYAEAIQNLLDVLDDSVTQVIQEVPIEAAEHEVQPTVSFLPEDILVITINDYQGLLDIYGTINRMGAIKQDIPRARGILFDLRAKAPFSQERGYLSYAFLASEIATQLTSTPLLTPGERFRMHFGYAPEKGTTSGDYYSAFRVVDGPRISPAPEAKSIPIVFLANAWSELPREALAFQLAGKAVIIAEGQTTDASFARTHQISLGDGIVVQMRISEVVYANGSGGFHPDVLVAASERPREDNRAFTAALEMLRNFKPKKNILAPLPAHPVSRAESIYSEMKLPPLEYRLLAAFRIWAIINYFFPYKELMEKNWDDVLLEFIPKMEQANSPLVYHLTVAEMITHINDSHGSVDSPVLKEYFGSAWPPVRLQLIENVPVITTILDEEAARNAGVNRGDIVLTIDGEDALTRIGDRTKYNAASTPHRLMYRAALASLSGPEGSFATLSIRDRNNSVQEVKLKRKVEYGNIRLPERNREIFKLISDEIGYADLDRLEVPMVDEMFEKFKDTKAIIFDMRGYPKGTAWAIASRLTNKNDVGAALFQCPVAATPDGTSDGIVRQTITYSFVQSLPPPEKWRYEGKTVMLIDERTQSQAEHTGLFFRAANGTKFIGSHSSGANGDVTNFFVPGGINIRITGQSVKHADGRQLQRVGLVPDIEVKPTIQGIQNDEDEVLACAINYLQHELGEGKSKQ